MPLRPEHVVSLQGRNYVVFPGLLNLAHESGLRSINTELVQVPTAENGHCAIVRATAVFTKPASDPFTDTWSAYGDASPANTKGPIQTALIRMAETRAVGRVLRMACNVGETLLEELSGDDETPAVQRPAAAAVRTVEQKAAPAAPGGEGEIKCDMPGCGKPLHKNLITRSQHHFKRNLCFEHCEAALKEAGK